MIYQTYNHNRNYGCRITEFIYSGYRCISLENERLRVSVVADKGSDIYEFLYKPRDVDFLWRSWVGLRPWSHHSPTTPRAAGPHMDFYEGGWQELFPNCGRASLHQGAEIGQHGEVLMLPWSYVITTDTPDEVEIRFEVRTVRTPFHLVKTLSLRRNDSVLRIKECVTNEGGQAVDFTWGHHPALGWPFIEEGCKIHLPDCRIIATNEFTPPDSRLRADQDCAWPTAISREASHLDLSFIPGPEAAAQDMVFLRGMTDGWFAVTNPKLNLGFGIRYPADVFKFLWFWQVYRGGSGYPWWGATYNIALEPCATMPGLSESAGDALSLGPGQSLEVELLAVAYEGLESVGGITDAGKVLAR
jgi:galactose mutarotase-like enzyme